MRGSGQFCLLAQWTPVTLALGAHKQTVDICTPVEYFVLESMASTIVHVSPSPPQSRSMGLKLIIVGGLALLMSIPAFFVMGLVNDRAQRAANVTAEIAQDVGGPQTFLGPTLAIPCTFKSANPADPLKHGTYVVFPAKASAMLNTSTQERHRSLFTVPVYQADLKLNADFDLSNVPNLAPAPVDLDWRHAEIIVGVSDPHGALTDATLSLGGKVLTLVPADITDNLQLEIDDNQHDDNQHAKLTMFGAHPGEGVQASGTLQVTSILRFSGAERICVLAYGEATQLTATGDWRNPGFDGHLPVSRNINDHGFTAKWSVPFIARGVRAQGLINTITGLNATAMGISFVEVTDPYQSVNRSLKYSLLFLGLVFLSYFVFEVTTGKRVHPAQYLLVGVAQIIFYLLLLSLSERTGFDAGFLFAGGATVILLSTNAGWVFSSRLQAIRAFMIFSALYSLIYLLLRLEDNALLVGAIAGFLAVATAMYLTRSIDWYSTPLGTAASRSGAAPLPPTTPA